MRLILEAMGLQCHVPVFEYLVQVSSRSNFGLVSTSPWYFSLSRCDDFLMHLGIDYIMGVLISVSHSLSSSGFLEVVRVRKGCCIAASSGLAFMH